MKVKLGDVGYHSRATLTLLTAPDGWSHNELNTTNVVNKAVTTLIAGVDGTFNFEMPNYSIAVVKT